MLYTCSSRCAIWVPGWLSAVYMHPTLCHLGARVAQCCIHAPHAAPSECPRGSVLYTCSPRCAIWVPWLLSAVYMLPMLCHLGTRVAQCCIHAPHAVPSGCPRGSVLYTCSPRCAIWVPGWLSAVYMLPMMCHLGARAAQCCIHAPHAVPSGCPGGSVLYTCFPRCAIWVPAWLSAVYMLPTLCHLGARVAQCCIHAPHGVPSGCPRGSVLYTCFPRCAIWVPGWLSAVYMLPMLCHLGARVAQCCIHAPHAEPSGCPGGSVLYTCSSRCAISVPGWLSAVYMLLTLCHLGARVAQCCIHASHTVPSGWLSAVYMLLTLCHLRAWVAQCCIHAPHAVPSGCPGGSVLYICIPHCAIWVPGWLSAVYMLLTLHHLSAHVAQCCILAPHAVPSGCPGCSVQYTCSPCCAIWVPAWLSAVYMLPMLCHLGACVAQCCIHAPYAVPSGCPGGSVLYTCSLWCAIWVSAWLSAVYMLPTLCHLGARVALCCIHAPHAVPSGCLGGSVMYTCTLRCAIWLPGWLSAAYMLPTLLHLCAWVAQ